MSRHWNPQRAKWTVIDGYAPARPARKRRGELSPTMISVVLVAAACFGIAVGLGHVPVIASPGSDLRTRGEAVQPGLPRGEAARNDAVRAAFGYCYSGGGTNCVVDGDTFWIGGEKVRIAGIDAPETHPSRCDDEARLGEAATGKLHDLLNSGAVTMTSIDRDRDVYGRLLRNVAVNGADVGDAMVSAGVAREYGGGRRPWC